MRFKHVRRFRCVLTQIKQPLSNALIYGVDLVFFKSQGSIFLRKNHIFFLIIITVLLYNLQAVRKSVSVPSAVLVLLPLRVYCLLAVRVYCVVAEVFLFCIVGLQQIEVNTLRTAILNIPNHLTIHKDNRNSLFFLQQCGRPHNYLITLYTCSRI